MDNFDYLRTLVLWYRSYYLWNGPTNIRAFELKRTRNQIMLAGTIVRVDRKKAYHE